MDLLRRVVANIREEIEKLGGEVLFQTRFIRPVVREEKIAGADIIDQDGARQIACDSIFLGPGHSARDLFIELQKCGIPMEKKVFSIGLRIEHRQAWLNERQYGRYASHPKLPPADYKLSVRTKTGKILYSFCMCPGGFVVPATSAPDAVVTNGMSFFARDGENANAALLISFAPEEVPGDLFSGFSLQEKLERDAYRLGGGDFAAPAQTVGDYLNGQSSVAFGSVLPSYARGAVPSGLSKLFNSEFNETMRDGIHLMDEKLPGFSDPDAVLTGPESRSTCPVRILRDETRQSRMRGLYPIGEGAGYAGGIMSSAMDGIKSAVAFLSAVSGRDGFSE